MASEQYTPPTVAAKAFHCPHCGAYAHQRWSALYEVIGNGYHQTPDWKISRCTNCEKDAAWAAGSMILPSGGNAPLPNPDMPEDIKRDYEEARAILNRSPRGSAALLRLAVQKLCKALGKPGKNIDNDIAALVKDGLPERVQKALDTVRVVGNEAVHPGAIDLRDDPALAGALFRLVNMIVEKMISEPREIAELYAILPEVKREAIDRRDAKVAADKD